MRARLAENLANIRERIAEAAARAGRQPESVRLVAVTKFIPVHVLRWLVELGCADLGESRPQEFWGKADALADLPIRWHFVGHLQRNKVVRTLARVHLLHAGDSLRLLEAVDNAAAARGEISQALLEVNISGEGAKHGFSPAEVEPLLGRLAELRQVKIMGLMGMARLEGGTAEAARDFERLAELREKLRRNCPAEISLDELSMGMSGDFEQAIGAGATLVRVGSALFEGIVEQ